MWPHMRESGFRTERTTKATILWPRVIWDAWPWNFSTNIANFRKNSHRRETRSIFRELEALRLTSSKSSLYNSSDKPGVCVCRLAYFKNKCPAAVGDDRSSGYENDIDLQTFSSSIYINKSDRSQDCTFYALRYDQMRRQVKPWK